MTLTGRDSDRGITAEDLPLIFDRFYRADKSRAEENGESGLGLAIAKALVEAHGGKIEASSVAAFDRLRPRADAKRSNRTLAYFE